MNGDLLEKVLTVLAASIPLSLVLRRLGQSTVLGYLLTGLAIGPGGLRLIDERAIQTLAELGVALLLFSVGIELSFAQIRRARSVALLGGPIQVAITAAASGAAVALATGRPLEGAYVGCAVALSSSAIVLKTLADRGELDAPHAAGTIGISIVQDLATVPMLVLLPVLGRGAGAAAAGAEMVAPIAGALGKAALVLGVMWLGSRVVVGPALHFVARTRSPEVFVVTIMTLVLAAAWGAAQVGLSIAIGTFCAGLLFSESEYAHQILADILPFRDVFQTLFFVSVGMLLDPRWVAAHPGPVAAAVVAVIAGKTLLAALAARLGGAPARVAVAIGVALAQIGEFSFVLLTLGRSAGALSEEVYQLTLAASVGSMAVAPPLIANVRGVLDALARLPLVGRAIAGGAEADLGRAARDKRDHVVIVGFGPVGRDVAQFLLDHGIDFVVIELNPGTVREFRERGIDIYFGDATNRTVLAEAAVDRARALVVAIPDPATAKRTVRAARALNAKLPIVARTKYRADADAFARLGAGEVVEEEFETAREMVLRLACAVGIPRRLAIERMAGQRLERYRVGPPRERYRAEGWPFPPIEIEVARVARKSPLAGKSIGEAAVRSRTGATIVAIVREAGTILYPGPDARIEAHDRIACLGTPEELESIRKLAGSD